MLLCRRIFERWSSCHLQYLSVTQMVAAVIEDGLQGVSEHVELEMKTYLQLRKFQSFLLKHQSYLCNRAMSFYGDIIIRLKQSLRENGENVSLLSWAVSLYSLVF